MISSIFIRDGTEKIKRKIKDFVLSGLINNVYTPHNPLFLEGKDVYEETKMCYCYSGCYAVLYA